MGKSEDSEEGLEEASEGDLMPQDGDEALDAGEEDFADEEWESYDEEPAGDEGAPPQKKKSSNFNKIVIAVTVVVGGGVAWMMAGGGGGGSAPAPAAAPAPQQQVAAAPTQRDLIYGSTAEERRKEEEARLEEPKGFLNNPDSLKKVEDLKNEVVFEGDEPIEREPDNSPDSEPYEVDYEPPMPAPMTPAGAEDGQGQQAPEQEQAQQEVLTPLPSDTLSAGLPAAEDIVRQPDSADAEVESPAPVETSGGVDFAGINEKLDDLAARLKGVESRLASLGGLEKRIQTLETRPAGAQPKKSAPAAVSEAAPEPPHDRAAEDNPEESVLTPDPVPVAPDSGPALQATPSAAWVLKSARPGEALVAKKGGDGTLSVRTGDSLAGIGRITDIYSENNRWIVQGTSGRIVQ